MLGLILALVATLAYGSGAEDATALHERAVELYEAGQFDEAEEQAAAALEARETELGPDHPDVAGSARMLGIILRSKGRYAEARALIERALSIQESAYGPVHLVVAETLMSLAVVLGHQADFDGAIPLIERCIAIQEAELGAEHLTVARSMGSLAGMLGSTRRDGPKARRLLERSLEIQETILGPDHPALASTLGNLAVVLGALGEREAAWALHQRNLRIKETALGPDHPDVAGVLTNLAYSLAMGGDLAGAKPLVVRALGILEAALGPDHPEVGTSLGMLAAIHDGLGDPRAARPLLERGLAIGEATLGADHPELAATLHNLAMQYDAEGDYAAARPLLLRSLRILEQAYGADNPDFVRTRSSYAMLLYHQGDYLAARPLLEAGVAFYERAGAGDGVNLSHRLSDLSLVCEAEGDLDGARALQERSLALLEVAVGSDHGDYGTGLNNLAGILDQQGDTDGALEMYERALEIRRGARGSDSPDVAQALHNIARIRGRKGDHEGAIALYRQALDIWERALGPDHIEVAAGLHNLAAVLRAAGDVAGARAALDRALAIGEQKLDLLRMLSEREALAHVAATRAHVDTWLLVHQRPDDHTRAWSTALRWKGIATRELRERRDALSGDHPEAVLVRDRLRQTRAELARLTFAQVGLSVAPEQRARQVALSQRKEELERELATLSSKGGERSVRDVGPAEVCAALPDGTALIDFLRYGEDYLAFAVVAPECEVHRVNYPEASEVDRVVSDWRKALASNQATPRIDMRGALVREQILDPLEAVVAGADRLLVSPDSALSALPFAALPLEEGGYLIERLSIGYIENARDLTRAPSTGVASGLLLVGDVDFAGDVAQGPAASLAMRAAPCVDQNFGPLPGTTREIQDIQTVWTQGRHRDEAVESLTGQAASEPNLLASMGQKRIVHLATHGFFASGECRSSLAGGGGRQNAVAYNPMLLSGIALAGVNAERTGGEFDGILTAEELGSLELPGTEIVVLSACETGLGVVRAGEGVLGLRRALAAAGAQHVVMSLWAVPDLTTTRLMAGFYERVLHRRRPADPADAMGESQLEVLESNRKKYRDSRPGSWAAFVVASQAGPATGSVDR